MSAQSQSDQSVNDEMGEIVDVQSPLPAEETPSVGNNTLYQIS